MATKAQLRKHISILVSKMPKSEKEYQSKQVYEKVIEHHKYKEAKRLSIYLSTDNEINTIPILKHALEVANKRCFVPLIAKTAQQVEEYFDGKCRMIMVELKSMKDYQELPTNSYGIKEHCVSETIKDLEKVIAVKGTCSLDLMIIPGVAFTLNGSRLGHGKGYYDEFLGAWKSANGKNLQTLGLAFKEQMLDEELLPMFDGHDFRIDEVISA